MTKKEEEEIKERRGVAEGEEGMMHLFMDFCRLSAKCLSVVCEHVNSVASDTSTTDVSCKVYEEVHVGIVDVTIKVEQAAA
uniref:Uncharacterized protein n=1 Tax=Syphacia muris TaxID=451379 RepID=A0A0N5AZI5_9BILA